MKPAFDFIVIGAQKAGTTALFEYIRRHPEISVPAGKEAPFYSHDSIWGAGWAPYAEKAFAFAPESTRWGVATPHYMLGSLYEQVNGSVAGRRPEAIVPARIKQHAPGAKLIAILRDPVERAYSHYRMQVLRGNECAPFEQAVAELLKPEALEQSRRRPTEETSYVSTGEYGRILAPYFELFGPEQVLVCFSRDLDRTPEQVMCGLWAFLGVEQDFTPDNLGRRYRVGGERKRAGWLDMDSLQSLLADSRPVRAAWRTLPAGVRRRVDATYNELNYRLELWNRTTGRNGHGPSAGVEEQLRAHFAADRAQLVSLLGEEPPWA
jgi:Sulfotransferase family